MWQGRSRGRVSGIGYPGGRVSGGRISEGVEYLVGVKYRGDGVGYPGVGYLLGRLNPLEWRSLPRPVRILFKCSFVLIMMVTQILPRKSTTGFICDGKRSEEV